MKRDRTVGLGNFFHYNGGFDSGESSGRSSKLARQDGSPINLFGHRVETMMGRPANKHGVEMAGVEEEKGSFDPALEVAVSVENGVGRRGTTCTSAKGKEVLEIIEVEEEKGGEEEGSVVGILIKNGGAAGFLGGRSIDGGVWGDQWNQEMDMEKAILAEKASSDVTLEVIVGGEAREDVQCGGSVEGAENGEEVEVQSIKKKNEMERTGWGDWKHEGEVKWREWENAANYYPFYSWWAMHIDEADFYQNLWDFQLYLEDQAHQQLQEVWNLDIWNFYDDDDDSNDDIFSDDSSDDACNVGTNPKSPET